MITQLTYSNTNTYLLRGNKGSLLFDTGWAGTFNKLCKALGDNNATLQEIKYLLISHYHPDHMGIAQEIASYGVQIVVVDVQLEYIHNADAVFEKDSKCDFTPICDKDIRVISTRESRDFLAEIGLQGEIFHTPGHSDDSISLMLDDGALFVGDLNPLYELKLHRGTQIAQSWDMLLKYNPSVIYYGHAKFASVKEKPKKQTDLYSLTRKIIKYIDRGYELEKTHKKTGADETFISDVARMYVTHQNVGVQGILDRIEIKGK